MSRRHYKSTTTFPISVEKLVSATVLVVLCCCLVCNHVSCGAVEDLPERHNRPNDVKVKLDAQESQPNRERENILNVANDHKFKFEDVKDARSFIGENFSSPKTSCNVLYMVVSTIDGKVSALDLLKQGSLAWSIEADSHPLYSSSLAQMEIVRNGKKIRLIPSLDGALYQFDGEKVEAIPMSTDSLLSSTYKLSDDSMIVGSKDIRNYGVDLKTGQIHFTCSSDGCMSQDGAENSDLSGNDVVIVTRSTQIIRSVDIKQGNEKWNFSVGEHRISIPPTAPQSQIEENSDGNDDSIPFFSHPTEQCPNKDKDADEVDYESLLQLLVPEGKVVALDRKHSRKVAWEHKFGSPIARAWLLRNGRLEPMNLFDPKHVPTLSAFTTDDLENDSVSQPMLYIGSHKKLLYIQPSPQMETILKTFPNHRIGHVFDPKIQVSWRPYLSTASARTPIFGGNRQDPGEQEVKEDKGERHTSLSVWHEEYPFDTGYFLYPEFRDSRSTKKGQLLLIENLQQSAEQPGSFMGTIPASMWHYWKEITSLTVVVSIIVHVFLTRFLTPVLQPSSNEEESSLESGKQDSSNNHELSFSSDKAPSPSDKSSGEYVSRFETDFDYLHCLGKGGYGIVFEAVNKLDGHHYAVKRIMLPKSDGAKERVLREVKALAQLEHPGIVRYFNSWEESPPLGWQKDWDTRNGLCDDTRNTLFTSSLSQMTEKSELKQKIIPGRRSRSEAELETQTDTDSVVFLPDTGDSKVTDTGLPGSGSGEFSVHSNLSETNSWPEDFSGPLKSIGLLSQLQMSASGPSDDSLSGSKSSIPFSNYTSNSSKRNGNSDLDVDMSGDSVVFEASNKELLQSSKHSVTFTLSHTDNEEEENDQVRTPVPGNSFFLYIQTQLYQKETLKEWLSNNTLNRERQVILEIFDQIMCAVDYVHSHDLMHRDLKPSNIFFAADGTIKVGDFGLATALSAKQDTEMLIEENTSVSGRHTADVGTTLYMSPEQNDRKPYNLTVDIFAMGLIFLELWVPFSTQMERIRTLQDAKRQILPSRFLKELPIESKLVKHMTSPDPSQRPSTREILNHDLLREVASQRIDQRKRTRTISGNSNN